MSTSTSELAAKFRLYTVAEVAELFPQAGTSAARHVKAVEELVRQHGCYRKFGDAVLLTERDVADLFRNIAVRGPGTPEPQDGDDGHAVFIGSRTDASAEVFVDWCAPGAVDACVRRVKEVTPSVDLLDFAAMTYGQYVEWTERLAKQRCMGKWFYRTREFNAAMVLLFPEGANDDEQT